MLDIDTISHHYWFSVTTTVHYLLDTVYLELFFGMWSSQCSSRLVWSRAEEKELDVPERATALLSSSPPLPPWPPVRIVLLLWNATRARQLNAHSIHLNSVAHNTLSHTEHWQMKMIYWHHQVEAGKSETCAVPGKGARLSSSTSAPWNGSVTKSDLKCEERKSFSINSTNMNKNSVRLDKQQLR